MKETEEEKQVLFERTNEKAKIGNWKKEKRKKGKRMREKKEISSQRGK